MEKRNTQYVITVTSRTIAISDAVNFYKKIIIYIVKTIICIRYLSKK